MVISVEYVVVVNIDLVGLGFDDVKNDYVIFEEDRKKRKKVIFDVLSYILLS